MVAFPRNPNPKSLKRRVNYNKPTKKIQLPTLKANFRLLSTVSQGFNEAAQKSLASTLSSRAVTRHPRITLSFHALKRNLLPVAGKD